MPTYIQFNADEDDSTILIEVEDYEIQSDLDGTTKVGIRSYAGASVAIAQRGFKSAIRNAIRFNIEGLLEGISALPNSPSEAEITFGLKATGEIGNIAVGKVGSETNYTVKLTWKNLDE